MKRTTRNRAIAAAVVSVVLSAICLTREPAHEPIRPVPAVEPTQVATNPDAGSPKAKSPFEINIPKNVKPAAEPQPVPSPETAEGANTLSEAERAFLDSVRNQPPKEKPKSPLSEAEQEIMGLYCKCNAATPETETAENELLAKATSSNATTAEKAEVYLKILSNFEGSCNCSFMQIQASLFKKLSSLLDQMQPLDAVKYLISLRASGALFSGLNFTLDSKMQAVLLKVKDNISAYSPDDLGNLATQLDALADQTHDDVYKEYAGWFR